MDGGGTSSGAIWINCGPLWSCMNSSFFQEDQMLDPPRSQSSSRKTKGILGDLSVESPLVSRHCRSGLDAHSRTLPEARVFIDPLAHVQHELRRGSGYSLAVRHVIERALQFGMLVDVLANLAHGLAGRLEAFFELGLGFNFCLPERHLHAAVCVDLAFAGSLDRKEDHVLELVDDRRLHTIGLRRRHASE